MGGGAGIALIGGLANGFAQGRKQAQEQELNKTYKDMMVKKLKNELDIAERQTQDFEQWKQDPNNVILGMRAGVFKSPKDALMFQAMQGGGQPQPQQANIGMNYEEPTTPQMTFSPQQTGAPMMPQIDPQRVLHKEVYGWDPAEAGPNVPNAIDPATQQRATGLTTKGGGIRGYVPTMPSHIEWVEHPTIPGIQIGYADGKPTGEVRQVAQGYDVKEVKKKLPDGSETTEFIHVAKRPGGLGSPKTALPGQIQMVIDPNKPGAIDEAITGLRQVQQQGAKNALTPSGGGRGGIQTGPATRGIHLTNKELSEYIDVNTGKPPKGQWTQDSIDASKQYVRKPEKVLGTEEAAKLGNAIEAVKNLPTIKERMFPGGQLDKDFSQALWLWHKSPEVMAGSEVAEYGKMLKQAIEAQIRLESGAAVPPEEIKRASERYITQLFSTPESVSKGFDMITNTLGTTVEMADPTGYYRAVSAKGRVDTSKKPSLSETKVLNGKTYIKKNGKWFEK